MATDFRSLTTTGFTLAFQSLKRGLIQSNQLKRDQLMTPAVRVRPCQHDRTRRTCRVARRLP